MIQFRDMRAKRVESSPLFWPQSMFYTQTTVYLYYTDLCAPRAALLVQGMFVVAAHRKIYFDFVSA